MIASEVTASFEITFSWIASILQFTITKIDTNWVVFAQFTAISWAWNIIYGLVITIVIILIVIQFTSKIWNNDIGNWDDDCKISLHVKLVDHDCVGSVYILTWFRSAISFMCIGRYYRRAYFRIVANRNLTKRTTARALFFFNGKRWYWRRTYLPIDTFSPSTIRAAEWAFHFGN